MKDFGDKVSDSEKEEVEKLIKETKDALEKDDTDDIKKASEKLSEKVMEVSSKVYQQQAAESQKNAENSSKEEESTNKKDNVKDAEFEEK